jgi:aryl carrier-like protein
MDNSRKKELLTLAWKEALGVSTVTEQDNFFEAGGDSVGAVRLASYLAQMGLKLDMLKLYTRPTIAELAEELEEMQPAVMPENMTPSMFGQNAVGMPQAFAPQAMGGAMPVMIPMTVWVMLPAYMSQMPFASISQMSFARQPVPAPGQAMTVPGPGMPRLGKVTKSPEDALDAALLAVFPDGYDKQVNLFEQGLDSLKMVRLASLCAEEGYRIGLQDFMKDPTFKGVVAGMKTE